MSRLQYLNELDEHDRRKLVDSIDYVFFDIDGVLAIHGKIIQDGVNIVNKMKQLGKKIAYVSNNTIYPMDVLMETCKLLEPKENELVTPIDAFLVYLKNIGFEKDIYALSCSMPKKRLREAGYNVIEYKDIHTDRLEEHLIPMKTLCEKALDKCKNIGLVFVDNDLNFQGLDLQVATALLTNIKDVIFICGVQDDAVRLSDNLFAIGPKYFYDGLERWTKIKSRTIGKPGELMKDVLNSRYNVTDPSRVLFIGDNAEVDIGFGVNCGYKTLLVLSGMTTKEQVDEWAFSEHCRPDFVTKNIGELYEYIKDF